MPQSCVCGQIMMTTFAAVLRRGCRSRSALASGASLRQPLGITVMGGLIPTPGIHALHNAGDLRLYLDRAGAPNWSGGPPDCRGIARPNRWDRRGNRGQTDTKA